MSVLMKMYLKIALIYMLLITTTKSDEFKWKFLNGTEITHLNYCDDHNCIVKCCPDHQFMKWIGNDTYCRKIGPRVKKFINFSLIDIYDINGLKKTNENLQSKFTFVYIESFINNSNMWINEEITIVEDGSIKMKDGVQETKLRFCVDFLHKPSNPPTAVFVFRTINSDDPEAWNKHLFVSTGMLISCFFLLFVLIVYYLLPSIRGGLWGVILMTYIVTVLISFTLKAVQDILMLRGMNTQECFRLTSVMYYFILSYFFWSNVLSYHMWYNLANPTSRSTIKSRKSIGKLDLSEKRKYAYYCLYAFGIPGLITGFCVIIDHYGWYSNEWFKPPFENCLHSGGSTWYYLIIPVGVLLFVNCIFFSLTAYYIWFVERNMNNAKGSKTSKSQKYSFFLYLKISALMGIGWLMELIPIERLNLILFVVLAFYNVFTGVFIFIILVCKKKILIELCKKFGIMNQYVLKHQNYSSSRGNSTRTTGTRKQDSNNEDKTVEETFI